MPQLKSQSPVCRSKRLKAGDFHLKNSCKGLFIYTFGCVILAYEEEKNMPRYEFVFSFFFEITNPCFN